MKQKALSDEELKKKLKGQPNAVCAYETFLNEISKGKAELFVENDKVVIETDSVIIRIDDIFKKYFEE